jgi:hypothetical protein
MSQVDVMFKVLTDSDFANDLLYCTYAPLAAFESY